MSDVYKIEFNFPDWAGLIAEKRDELMKFVAAQLQTQRAMIFEHEGAYNGRSRWDPLKFRRGQILSKAGGRGLRGSIAPRNNGIEPERGPETILEIAGEKVTIGTSLIYAEIHNKGGVIKPIRAKALKIPVDAAEVAKLQTQQTGKKTTGGQVRKSMGAVKLDGKWYMFRKKVTIPARPYLDFTQQDKEEIETALTNRIAELMNGI